MLIPKRRIAMAALTLALFSMGANAAMAQAVIVERAMPAPVAEVVPVAPGANFRWVPGHWVWRGMAWFWVKGHYIASVQPIPPMPVAIQEVIPVRPSPEHFWVRGHYAWEQNHWAWHRGVWVHP